MARVIGDDRDNTLTGTAGEDIKDRGGGGPPFTARGARLLLAVELVALAVGAAAPASAQGVTERVSVGPGGVQGNGFSRDPALSADGRFVAFGSFATNLVPGDTNVQADVLVHDRRTGTTRRVSVGPRGIQSNGESRFPKLSADGRLVAFISQADNLVPGDTNNAEDIFVRDRRTGTTRRVSVGTGGVQGDLDSFFPALSADGRFVAFTSRATNLAPGDTNGALDVFVHTR
jgi:Tol biopolymer transport system component